MPSTLPLDVRLMNASATVLFAATAIVLCGLVLLWAMRLPAFTLRAIHIDGDVARSNVPTIRANAVPRLGGTLFTVDLQQARLAFESVPWVRRAVVRREWPNGLRVTLEEHAPAAYWGEDRDARLVNTLGEVFDANPGDVEDDALPVLRGPQGQSRLMLGMHQHLTPLFAGVSSVVEALSLSDRGSWQAVLHTGARVELGRGEPQEVLDRAARFVHTLPQVVAQFQRPLEHADLRHRDGYAVRLRGITTIEPEDAAPTPAGRR